MADDSLVRLDTELAAGQAQAALRVLNERYGGAGNPSLAHSVFNELIKRAARPTLEAARANSQYASQRKAIRLRGLPRRSGPPAAIVHYKVTSWKRKPGAPGRTRIGAQRRRVAGGRYEIPKGYQPYGKMQGIEKGNKKNKNPNQALARAVESTRDTVRNNFSELLENDLEMYAKKAQERIARLARLRARKKGAAAGYL